jgi:hypothetical protein
MPEPLLRTNTGSVFEANQYRLILSGDIFIYREGTALWGTCHGAQGAQGAQGAHAMCPYYALYEVK